MKNIIILLSMMMILSCSKSSDNTTPTTTTGFIKMKIDGVVWNGTFLTSAIVDNTFAGTAYLDVNGKRDNLSLVVEAVPIGSTVKFEEKTGRDFRFVQNSTGKTYYISKNYKNSSGSFQVTKTTLFMGVNLANATFSGTAIDDNGKTIQISEGEVSNPLVK